MKSFYNLYFENLSGKLPLHKCKVCVILEAMERQRIVGLCHYHSTSGHFGVTLTRISERFYWPGMTNNLQEIVFHIV